MYLLCCSFLLFRETSLRDYYFRQAESMIFLFGVGREYNITDRQKRRCRSDHSDTTFSILAVFLPVLPADLLGSGDQLIDSWFRDLKLRGDLLNGEAE